MEGAVEIITLIEERMRLLHDELDRAIENQEDDAIQSDILSKLEILGEIHVESKEIKNSLQ